MKCTVTKVPKGAKMAGPGATPLTAAKGAAAPSGFNMQLVGDTFTIFGVDTAGRQIDISGIATLTPAPTSSDPAVVVVDAPLGMSCASREATPPPAVGAKADITVVATWNDGSIGPFTLTFTDTIIADPVTGIAVEHGTVTVV